MNPEQKVSCVMCTGNPENGFVHADLQCVNDENTSGSLVLYSSPYWSNSGALRRKWGTATL